jgi:hypothetical protein
MFNLSLINFVLIKDMIYCHPANKSLSIDILLNIA